MPPDRLVQEYTGHHWRVEPEALAEADHYSKYAIGAYGFDAEMLTKQPWGEYLRTFVRLPWSSGGLMDPE